MPEQITETGLLKSLSRLETMLQGDELEKGQIVTGGGSSQGNMTDMHQETHGAEWSDGIAPGGTDYNGRGKKARKGGAETREENRDEYGEDEDERDDEDDRDTEKGLPTAGEKLRTSKPPGSKQAIEPGEPGMTKAAPAMSNPYGERRIDKDPEVNDARYGGSTSADRPPRPAATPPATGSSPVKKSDHDYTPIRRSVDIEEDGELRKGIEVSEFLFFLQKSIVDSMFDTEQRLSTRIQTHHDARGEFAKGIAEAVVGINKSLNVHESGIEAEETAPAHAAKSVVTDAQQYASDLRKSIDTHVSVRKSVLNEMENLVQKGDGEVSALDIIRYDTTGDLRPEVQALLKSWQR